MRIQPSVFALSGTAIVIIQALALGDCREIVAGTCCDSAQQQFPNSGFFPDCVGYCEASTVPCCDDTTVNTPGIGVHQPARTGKAGYTAVTTASGSSIGDCKWKNAHCDGPACVIINYENHTVCWNWIGAGQGCVGGPSGPGPGGGEGGGGD